MDDPPIPSKELPVEDYADAVASGAPTPGGGSVVAVTGALAAGLCEMVCRLTLAGASPPTDPASLERMASEAAALRTRLLDLASEDERAYDAYRTAAALPRASDEEVGARRAALDGALLAAATVPLETARVCIGVLELLATAATATTKHALSDVSAGGLLAQAATDGALLNVEVNAKLMRDLTQTQRLLIDAEQLHLAAGRLVRAVQDNVRRCQSG